MSKTSIVVQGPLNPASIGNLGVYKQYGEVIISGWEQDNQRLLNYLPDNFKLVIKNRPQTANIVNMLNVYLQVCSTLNGLYVATNEYVIKLRSDEYFSTLSPITEVLDRYPDKIVSSNVYFSRVRPLHMSDHIIAAKKDVFIKAFEMLKHDLEVKARDSLCPEMAITKSFLIALGETIPHEDYMSDRPNTKEECELLIKHFHIIPVSNLEPFLVRCHHNGKRVLVEDEEYFDVNENCLDCVEQVRNYKQTPKRVTLNGRAIVRKVNPIPPTVETKTKEDYIKMQQDFYNDAKSSARDIVGFYEENEKTPFETMLLFKNQDIRYPVLDNTRDKIALDFGCGPGRLMKRMLKLFKKVDGADLCQRLIDEAKVNLPNSSFYLTNGCDAGNAPSDYYDFVYSTLCLQHIPSKTIRFEILRDLHRVLRPGGSICVQMVFSEQPVTKPHSGWTADYYSAPRTNSGNDVYITPGDKDRALNDFGGIFQEVDHWIKPSYLQHHIYLYGKK